MNNRAKNRTGNHYRSKLNNILYAIIWNGIDGEQMLLNLNNYEVVLRFDEEESFLLAKRMLKLEEEKHYE